MGIFDNWFNKIFSKESNDVNISSAGCSSDNSDSSLENIIAGLGISRPELEKIMQANGIKSVNNMLTQSQVDAIYDSYYRSLAPVTPARVNPVYKRIPVKIWPSQIIHDYSVNPSTKDYKNKWICFTGTVISTERDGNNFAVRITPDDKKFYGVMICRFVNNAEDKVMALRRGTHLTLTGFVYDVQLVYQNDTIVIINSSIVESFIPERSSAPVRPVQTQIRKSVSVLPITKIPDTKIIRSVIPGLNGKVYSENGKVYTLTKFISSGGEGSIYSIDAHGRVAKIYNEKSCTVRIREKIRLMASNRLNFKGICFPLEVLNNEKGEFTGFIMEEAKGRTLTCLKMPQSDFEKEFPSWKKDDLICLAISILKKIDYLHKHDVLMGDINLNNIMFTSPYDVYFIDTDSYQYGEYPCGVGTGEFAAPELLGRDLRTVMRTEGNENFAVATLLFMLMMQGKQPYAHQGGSQAESDIRAMIFPYGTGDRPVRGNVWELQPLGLYRYIWSHLSHKLKNAFIDTFRKDGRNNTEQTRLTVNDWLVLMYAYHTAMPNIINNDSMSAELFPTREKYSRDINYRVCKICGERLPESLFHDETTCRECYKEKNSNS